MKPDYSFKLAKRVENYITENEMIGHGDSVIIGLSGGADSVCLFLLLNKLKIALDFDLYAIHVNHGIRGESADRDEQFSKELCKKYNVPYKACSINIPQIVKETKQTEEEAGRNARYKIFQEYSEILANSGYKNVKIAVAHHINDQAETVLFNMIRGSGLKGISGMSPVNERLLEDNKSLTIIRPLLCVNKLEILEYLNHENAVYCTDETNLDNDYSRNLIRNEIIPDLLKIQPKTAEHVSLMADDAREAVELVDSLVRELYEEAVVEETVSINTECNNDEESSISSRMEYCIKIDKIKNEKPIIVRHLIIAVLKNMITTYKDITKTHIEDIYDLLNKGKGKYVMIPYGIVAQREKEVIRLKTK